MRKTSAKITLGLATLACAGLFAMGCGSNNGGGGGTGGAAGSAGTGGTGGFAGNPGVSITAPASTTVPIGRDANESVKLAFTTTNLRLSMNCGSSTTNNCGHLHVVIKDMNGTVVCNDGNNPYNNTALASPAYAQFRKCPNTVTLGSMHTFVIEGHHDDHTPILVNGTQLQAQIGLTNVIDMSDPYIAVSSPADGATIRQNSSTSTMNDFTFTTPNFMLKAPGECTSMHISGPCGHVHLVLINTATGTADCNDMVHSSPYNVAGQASPMRANTTLCPSVSGSHDVVLELHNDDHSDVKDTATGDTVTQQLVVGAKVHVTVSP